MQNDRTRSTRKPQIMIRKIEDIYRIEAFVTVVEEGSFSAAVSKLHITQPALSTRIKLLEESLDCALLERTPRGAKPTVIGKVVYKISQDILKRMQQMHTTVRNHQEFREGFVHLGGGATAVSGIFPDAISKFRHTYPDIQFTLSEQHSLSTAQSLMDESIDIGLITKNPFLSQNENPLQNLKVHGEIIDKLEIIAPIEHPLSKMARELEKQDKKLLPVHLSKQPMILFETGSVIHDIIDLAFRRLSLKKRVVMSLRSTQSMIKMVEKNIGISVVSRHALNPSQKVKILNVQNLNMERRILICTLEGHDLLPCARKFIEVLQSMFCKEVP